MKVAIIGYGKMGQEIEKLARSRGHEIVSIIDVNNPEEFESDAFRSADVAIEFTNPKAAYGNYLKAFAAGVKVVSGSTGWRAEHQADVEKMCSEEGKTLFWASNFSLGVCIFSAVNKYLAHIMNQFPVYDVSMTETHHIHKLDAPSGTAITLADSIVEELDRKNRWTKEKASAPDEFPIHSIREGEVPGIHTICYDSDADIITITHDAKNRSGFVMGAVLAAEYTATHQGLLTMNNLFSFLND
ncbi:MAG: 4-hydroxy-tetrahydrodipicolinate reductase [Bacteroidales bacterium]|nr:4-hydroxy-tetrahydrodipicolinate reductase [Bacteroidales bacterium]